MMTEAIFHSKIQVFGAMLQMVHPPPHSRRLRLCVVIKNLTGNYDRLKLSCVAEDLLNKYDLSRSQIKDEGVSCTDFLFSFRTGKRLKPVRKLPLSFNTHFNDSLFCKFRKS